MRTKTLSLAALLLASVCGIARADDVVLCREGKAALPIYAANAGEPVRELQTYLNRITGAAFEVKAPEAGGKGIFVGLLSEFPDRKIERAGDLGDEGFVIRSEDGSLYLLAAQPLGLQHAVTTFLHELGCRWFFPGETWEIVPRRETIAGAWDLRQAPSFTSQRRIWYGFGAYPKNAADKEAWDRHNRMGGPYPITIGHNWHGLDPKRDFAAHPEWFALVGDKRQPSKPCYSHPEVIRHAIAEALEQAARGVRVVSLSPPDGLGYCECAQCRQVFAGAEPFAAHDTLFAKRPDGTLVNITSETFFRMVNEIARAVAAKHPGTLVGTYAYSAYSQPPSFDFEPNVFVQLTTGFRRTPLTREEQIAAFGRRARHVGIRDYYSVYQWDWDGPVVAKGSLFLPQLAEDLRFYRTCGVTAINAEASNNWGPRGLGYYVASRLLWDVNTDVKEVVRDFYETAFGPAAPAIERYYARWYGPSAAVSSRRAASRSTASMPVEAPASELADNATTPAFDLDSLRGAFRDLDEAAALAAGQPGPRERVDHLRLYQHYLVLRRQLDEAAARGDRAAIVEGVKAETLFGARLMNTNMLHTRPLIGKAFARRFRPYMEHLAGLPEAGEDGAGKGFRSVREDVPAPDELARLWEEDRRVLGLAARAEPARNAPQAASWKAGVARIRITPEKPLWLTGYAARVKPSDGTLLDLHAKALALEDATGQRAVLVATDVLGFPAGVARNVARRIEERYGLARDRLLLNSSHTHSGPALATPERFIHGVRTTAEQDRDIEEYTRAFEDKVVEVVGAALADLQPARLALGRGTAGFGANRRVRNEAGEYSIGMNPRGPVDHDVPVLRVEGADGGLRAAVFGYACHNTTLNIYQFNGDYAGFAQDWLERRHPEAAALFVMGCGGDVNPAPRGTVELARQHGEALGRAVEAALAGTLAPVEGPLRTAFQTLPLAFGKVPGREVLQAMLGDKDPYRQAFGREMLQRLDRDGRLPASYPCPLQVWQFGDGLTLLAIGGEVVVDYALRLKKELGERVWVAGYSNDVFAYVPSRRIVEEGGYEGGGAMLYYVQPGPFVPEVEEAIIARLREMTAAVRR